MSEIIVTAKSREERGKNAARRLRRQGLIPGIVYGGEGGNISVAFDPRDLQKVFRSEAGRNTILKLDITDRGVTSAILKSWQIDPLKENFLHADFYRIAMDVAIRVTVPVILKGDAVGVKAQGGVLEPVLREIDVECLPGDIPEKIEVDVSELELNRAVRVSGLPVSSTVKILEDPDQIVVHVVAVKEEAAPAAAVPVAEGEAAATTAEPEVVKKGKKEEEPSAE